MAGFETTKLTEDKHPHLKHLLLWIQSMRQKFGPAKKCYNWAADPKSSTYKQNYYYYHNTFKVEYGFEYIKKNMDSIIKELDARWCISLINCYSDGHPDRETRLEALSIANLCRFDQFHLSFAAAIDTDLKGYNKSIEEFWKNNGVKGKDGTWHKKALIANTDRLNYQTGNTDSLVYMLIRMEDELRNKELIKLFQVFREKVSCNWSSLFVLGRKFNGCRENVDVLFEEKQNVEKYKLRRENNIKWYNNMDWSDG